jgi:hypothetical protein
VQESALRRSAPSVEKAANTPFALQRSAPKNIFVEQNKEILPFPSGFHLQKDRDFHGFGRNDVLFSRDDFLYCHPLFHLEFSEPKSISHPILHFLYRGLVKYVLKPKPKKEILKHLQDPKKKPWGNE